MFYVLKAKVDTEMKFFRYSDFIQGNEMGRQF